MARRKYCPEQAVSELRQIERGIALDFTVAAASLQIGESQQTLLPNYY